MSSAAEARHAVNGAMIAIELRLAAKPPADEEAKLRQAYSQLWIQLGQIDETILIDKAANVAAASRRLEQVIASAATMPLAVYFGALSSALANIGIGGGAWFTPAPVPNPTPPPPSPLPPAGGTFAPPPSSGGGVAFQPPPPPPPPSPPPQWAGGAALPPQLPPAGLGSGFVAELVRICNQEWEYFGRQQYDEAGNAVSTGRKEQEVPYSTRVGQYWNYGTNTPGIDGTQTGWPWSAAFVSWAAKSAGAGSRFRYSTQHSVYVFQAIRDRVAGRAEAGYWCERLNEYRPAVGDILCWGREAGVDYDSQKDGWYKGHCDVVVEVATDYVWIIGGNVGNSVTKRPVRKNAAGYLSPVVINGENLFGIMRCRIDQPMPVSVQPLSPTVPAPPIEQPPPAGPTLGTQPVAWGLKMGAELKFRVIQLAVTLGCDPSHISACMAFETGETFDPAIQNKHSNATGLIQFMPQTASSLGTSIASLKAMTAVQQMDYVEKYFSPYKGRLHSLSDVYMAILWPKAIGFADATALFVKGTKYYDQNAPLDVNSDGVVTKGEAASKVQKRLDKGLGLGLIG
ncbi:MAG: DUF2272 domain-containing protein [Rhizobiaceae bacterium]|nr:DUF2272 domain-containing protein [Rhizobiaceae bacterium]